MCVLSLKNTTVAIKSTSNTQVCFFMNHSAIAMRIKACNRKGAADAQERSAILNGIQIIYQRGCRQLPISRDGVHLHGLDMCWWRGIVSAVWSQPPEIWYRNSDISGSGSIDPRSEIRYEALNGTPLIWINQAPKKKTGFSYWLQQCLGRSCDLLQINKEMLY